MTKPNLSIKERFLLHIDIPENPNDCWIWKGHKNNQGYGQFDIHTKKWAAHRLSYTIFIGNIPKGMFILHRCDIPACVNPSHLFLGTQKDNMLDAQSKNRLFIPNSRGEQNGRNKLTEQDIYDIREMIEQGYYLREIADKFGVGISTIFDIKSGKNWGWLK